tara:strand:+ start:734 stop:886 length:153 start_codon:yes stop_codon:yes gene_type:complete
MKRKKMKKVVTYQNTHWKHSIGCMIQRNMKTIYTYRNTNKKSTNKSIIEE